MNRLQNKVAVITGGGSGIGAATATLFAQEGASVLVVGRTAEKLRDTVRAINRENVAYCVADVSKAEDTQRYVAEAVERFGGIDVLVSNAGTVGPVKPVTDCAPEEFDEVMATNVRGIWLSARYAFPVMQKRGGGSLIVTSSVAGVAGIAALSPYITSKHAVIGLARALAHDGAPARIRVNAVCPGATDNDMMVALQHGFAPGNEDQMRKAFEARFPLKRYGTNEEVARLYLFLASEDSSYVTGGVYMVDGGWSAGVM